MTEDIPEREARAFDQVEGETIFITQRDGMFYAYKIYARIYRSNLSFWKTSSSITIMNIFNVRHTAPCLMSKQVNVFRVRALERL